MLEIKNVVKKYGNKIWSDHITFNVADGEIFGFIGPNGAGKTTLIKAISGIHKFDEGDIILDGISIKDDPIAYKKMIAYIPDNPDIYPNIKGIDYLNFIADIFKVDEKARKERISRYAKLFEIENDLDNIISAYSHGMKQKLVIISALIHQPKLLILDEPFVGLDPKSTKNLKDLMRELTKNKTIIFFSSHVLEVVEKLCDQVGIINNGKLIELKDKDLLDKSLEDYFMEKTKWATFSLFSKLIF